MNDTFYGDLNYVLYRMITPRADTVRREVLNAFKNMFNVTYT